MRLLSWAEIWKIALFSSIVSLILSLMMEVLFGQIFLDLIQNSEEKSYLILIILIGFLIGMIISLLSAFKSADRVNKRYLTYATIIAFVLNILVWIVISWICIQTKYDIVENLSVWERVSVIPRVLALFSIYCLPNVTLLWFLAQITFSLIFAISLRLLKTPKESRFENYRRI